MTADPVSSRWGVAKRLFEAALPLPPESRASFLEAAAAGDDQLCEEVLSLLAAHDAVPSEFLERSAFGSPPVALHRQRVGPYRLLEEIGRGGMGTVYLASRDDQEFDQRVAIKLIRGGVADEVALRRFRTERQILATLAHPNIARLLDGGTTADGVPFIAMEHVTGEPIDLWCDSRAVGLHERLRLFATVCDAVDYAHRNLVVHRDIKPANVLVDETGTPKLLDFGIAKLMEPDQGTTPQTATEWRVLTPEYASPEQLRGERLSVASDVYSLGTLLYELLAGCNPFAMDAHASRDLVLLVRTLGEKEPVPPSAALNAATAMRGERWRRELRGDLDNIVLKAIRREPAARYESAAQLAADIRSHLAGQPVLARRPTLSYRARKFLRRNAFSVGAAVVVVSTLAASTVFSMQQAAVARAEKRRAEHDQALATRRYEEVRQLARHFLFELHASLEPVPGSLEVRRLVATQSLRQLDKLAADASGDPEILADLAAAYEKLGTVGIGVEETERIRRVAVALNEQVVRRAPGNDDFQAQLASSLAWLGNVLKLRGDRAGERESYQRSFTIMKGVVARNPDRRAHREQLKAVCEDLGRALAAQGRLDDAILHQRQALDMARSLARSYPSELAARRSVVISLHMLSTTLISADRWDEAGANYREALRLVRPLAAAHPENANYRRDHWFVKRGLARVLSRQGDHQAALAHLREALALKRSLLQADPADRGHQRGLAVTLLSLGEALERSGDAEGALVEYERSVAAGERLLLLDPEVEETWTDLRLEYDRLHSLLGTMGRRSSQHQVREREAALYRRLRQRYPASKRAEAAVAPAPAFRLAGP